MNNVINKVPFLVDTGSEITSINHALLNRNLNEAILIAKMCETKIVTGILKAPDAVIKYYKVPIDLMIFSDMHIKNSYIWVTFNDNVTDSVLGMDILEQLFMFHAPGGSLLLSSDLDQIRDYINGGLNES